MGSPHGLVVNALDYDIVVKSLNSSYAITFSTNILGKGMNPLTPPALV